MLPGNKTWISVHLKERPNLARFPQRAYAEKIAHLNEFSQRTQQPLIDFVNSFGNQIDSLKSFWVYNGFCLKATKPVILAIVGRQEVDFINGGEAQAIEQGPSGYAPPPPEREWNIERVGAHLVWLHGYTGEGIVICIFDKGMLEDHEAWWADQDNNKWRRIFPYPNYTYAWKDFNPQNPSPTPVDYNGHGTHVGGIAIGGDGWGGPLRDIGVAPGAKLIACTPRYDYSNLRHACFQWIASLADTPYGNLAPDVVNCSWGDPFNNENLEYWNDVVTLRALDIIPVFCIGNVVSWPNWPPGNFPTTIGVGVTDVNDNWAIDFSGHGLSPTSSPWSEQKYWSRPDWQYIAVDLVAPGTKYSTTEGIYSADKNNPHGYISMWGTSQATPHVTGAIALMQEAAMDNFGHKLDYYDIYDILIESANPVGQDVPNIYYGWGRLDCRAAVDSVINFRLKSSSPSALANNNQRKIVYDPINQIIHMVYQSGQTFERHGKYIRYTYSTDFGQTWSIEEKVGDGDAPCLVLDDYGNPHCIFKDGGKIRYNRRIGNQWEGGYTIFQDWYFFGIREAPSFAISGTIGHVAFEAYGLGDVIRYGWFDITSPDPFMEWITLDFAPGTGFPLGAPSIAVQGNNISVVYAYPPSEPWFGYEVILRSSSNDWQPEFVSTPDLISSVNPHIIATSDKIWIFWEDGGIDDDVYYRVKTANGWENDPTPVYQSATPSIMPRAFYNTMEPDKIYCVWSEFDNQNNQWDIFCSTYYDDWQSPINISNTVDIDSKDADVTFMPQGIIEGKLAVLYAEGNEYWSSRSKFLPLYWVRTYVTSLPLGGGGPQTKGDNKCDILFNTNPNPFHDRLSIKFEIRSSKSESSLKIYDVSGRLVRQWDHRTMRQGNQIFWDATDDFGRGLPSGVYFVKIETGSYSETERVVFLR